MYPGGGAQCGSGYLVVYGGWRYIESEPEIDNESVTLTVKSDADITNLAPVFTLTPGATITPASGSAFDFTTPRPIR